ncbi:MAG TPA: O-methyltransferase [Nitrospiria bacterium]
MNKKDIQKSFFDQGDPQLDIIHPQIEGYLLSLLPKEDSVLSTLEAEAERRRFPIVGPLVGRILEQLTRMTGAARVFEMGSGFGYSAYWFAKGLRRDGTVILTDGSSENIKEAMKNLPPTFPDRKFIGEVGEAIDILGRYPGPFDIIFNDIDKEAYPDVIQVVLPKLKKGGLLVSDNVLWFGSVISKSEKPDVQAIQKYNQMIYNEKGLLTTILPIRDGLSISQKIV